MDLMEILKGLFGEEALTFEQFAEKVNNAADVKLGNLAGGQYIEKDKFDDLSKQLETANASLADYDPEWRSKLEHLDRICEVLNCDISDLPGYQPNKIKKQVKTLLQIQTETEKCTKNENTLAEFDFCKGVFAKLFNSIIMHFFFLCENYFILRKATTVRQCRSGNIKSVTKYMTKDTYAFIKIINQINRERMMKEYRQSATAQFLPRCLR